MVYFFSLQKPFVIYFKTVSYTTDLVVKICLKKIELKAKKKVCDIFSIYSLSHNFIRVLLKLEKAGHIGPLVIPDIFVCIVHVIVWTVEILDLRIIEEIIKLEFVPNKVSHC